MIDKLIWQWLIPTMARLPMLRKLAWLRENHPEYFSKWFFGKFGFVCRDSVLYGKPIPYRGALGFFEVTLPE